MRVLTVNSGSSSLKLGLYEAGGDGEHALRAANAANLASADDFAAALDRLLAQLALERQPPDAVGHRLVVPGIGWTAPQRLDASVLAAIEALIPAAPDHLPQALAAIRATRARFPGALQAACSDSAFHHTLPEVARRLALPRAFDARGLRRCGYHGLSCESVLDALRREGPLPARVVIAHLGNGSSLTAVRDGRSLETSMGFTPLGGIPTSTRSGDLDPGALLHLLRREGVTADRLAEILNQQSGLQGVSGLSGDMRRLLELAPGDTAAALAVEMYVWRARQCLGGLAALLEGLDLLVFTGGIGENADAIRRRILAGTGWMGGFAVRVIPADEDRMVARHTAALAVPASQG